MKQKNRAGCFVKGVRRTRIQTRLLLTCLLLSLVPVLFIGMYAYNVYTSSINAKLADTSSQVVKLMNNNLDNELKRYTDQINAISVNEDIQNALGRLSDSNGDDSEDTALKAVLAHEVANVMKSTVFGRDYLRSIRIADRDGRIVYDSGYEAYSDELYQCVLASTEEANPNDNLSHISTYRGNEWIIIGRKIQRFPTLEHIGYILVAVNETLLQDNFYADVSYGETSDVLLFTGRGELLSSQRGAGGSALDSSLFGDLHTAVSAGKASFDTSLEDEHFLAVYNYNQRYDSYFMTLIPRVYITGETRQITLNLILVMAGLVAASVALTMLLYLSIMQPIKAIIARCNVVADEELDEPIADENPDELGFLARTIDRIILELKGMALEWQQDQRRKHELELEMLQYQINPHFLFNTLNTLKWVAAINEVPMLENGISSLSLLLQSTLMRKDETIALAEEIQNLRHYFSIQGIRYADSFDVVYELDEAALTRPAPRFILQPLAENAIIHGQEEEGRITIKVCATLNEKNDVLLEITDNGAGFDTANLAELPQRERFSGIGLHNVDERLRLHFGREYGLEITSKIGLGTRCRIVIPQKWEPEQSPKNNGEVAQGV